VFSCKQKILKTKMENCVETKEGISEEIEKAAEEASAALLPSKSKDRYEVEYDIFKYGSRRSKRY
jgi:hypothetical protein